ncbi:MAG: uncharacterized protein H6R10_1172 [Rhodocyclaceae bacterium]|nr:uncharacterized protein [Rhodocyclaceae bacterium]
MFRHVFFSAPHRLMFAGGAFQLLAAMALWAWILGGRYFALPVADLPWPPAWIHAGLMVFGIFPWFIFGFLMTALPKWMGAGPLSFRRYVPPFLSMAAGWGLYYGGLVLPPLGPAGLVLVAVGWLWGVHSLGRACQGSVNDRRHAFAALVALGVGAFGVLAYAWALAAMDAAWFRVAVESGLWGCLAPIFFIVLHRMLPFFTGAAIRPYQPYQPQWALWLMLAALAGRGLLAIAGTSAWRWLPDAVAAGIAWHLSGRWGLKAALKVPMVAMLHLGGLWLGAAMTLFALQSILAALGLAWGGLLPLHALGVGFFASILIGMSTRVTLGHSGRPIGEDRWAWRLFLALQGVVALRLAGEFAGALNFFAALAWLAVFGLWASRYFPMYLQPRPDGQPG